MIKAFSKGNTIAIALIVWALVILAITFGAFILKPWQSKEETISVSSSGKSQATPNIAKISATVSTNNDNLNLARQQNGEKVNNLISALKDLGIAEKDIKTQYISGGETYEIQSEPARPDIQIYPAPGGKQTNQISATFEVTIRDFTTADEIIAALTQNGATNIYGPNLTVDDETLENAKSEARKNAVENARKKAQELASELGEDIGDVVKVSEQGDYGIPVPIFAQSETDLKSRSSQIQPGENEVTVSIQVEFELD